MTDAELIERLADAEHASWSRWMAYLFTRCAFNADGSVTISERDYVHWQTQVITPYADLSEREKESDRKEVRHILPILREWKRD